MQVANYYIVYQNKIYPCDDKSVIRTILYIFNICMLIILKSISIACRWPIYPSLPGLLWFQHWKSARKPIVQVNGKIGHTHSWCIFWDSTGHLHFTAHRCVTLKKTQNKFIFIYNCSSTYVTISVTSTTTYPDDHARHQVFILNIFLPSLPKLHPGLYIDIQVLNWISNLILDPFNLFLCGMQNSYFLNH